MTLTNQTTCIPVAQSGGNAGTADRPSHCTWQAAVVATNLTTCSPSGSAAGPPYNSYTTCGYGTGVVATGLSSCTPDAAEAGPSYTGGQTVACAYQGSATTTDVTSGSCTTVAQDTTNFSATQVTCTYATATTPTVANCTNRRCLTGPTYTVLNSHSCAYGAGVATNPAAGGTCTVVPQTDPNFVGPAIDCSYSAGVSSTLNNQTSCVQKNAQPGPAFSGGGTVHCTYGTTSGWSNVASGTCTDKDPTTPLGPTGPTTRSGRRVRVQPAFGRYPDGRHLYGCARESGGDGTVYSVLQKKVCVAGRFPVVGAPAVTTVDNCVTDPTSVTNPAS